MSDPDFKDYLSDEKDEASDSSASEVSVPSLEMPPIQEGAYSTSSVLLADDSLAFLSAKFAVVEQLLHLLTRDYKFKDFCRELLLIVMKAVKSEAGSILEMDYKNKTLFFRAVAGQSSDRLANFVIPFGQGIVGYVAESRQPLVVSNVPENRVHLKSIEKAVGFETRNIVAVPIVIRGRVFAVLELLNRVGETTYTSSDVELLTYLCGIISKAIEIRLMLAWSAAQGSTQGDAENVPPSEGEAA